MEFEDVKYIFDSRFNNSSKSRISSIPVFGNYIDIVYTESM
ncbi:hypothetical protein [Methanobrevibacter sp.]|nr:hypothetical protein [Methanobrevibacter sp.]